MEAVKATQKGSAQEQIFQIINDVVKEFIPNKFVFEAQFKPYIRMYSIN